MPANPQVAAYIRQAAIARGIDPEVALRVASSEALNVFDPSKPDLGGDERSSFGPFQLHYAGMSRNMPNPGLGDAFTKATGLHASDPSTWQKQVDFALDQATQGGWGPWMGAKASGITGKMGIGGRPANAPPPVAGQPAAPDGPKGQEAYAPANQYALPATRIHPPNPTVGTGGYVAPGADTTPVPGAEAQPENWWQSLAKNIGKLGPTGGIGNIEPARGGMAQPAAARIDQPDVATIDPQQAEAQRQQLALAMQRLNSGKLWGAG
jgi:hypothetical protein